MPRSFLRIRNAAYTGFITTRCGRAGLCAEFMTDVYGTSCAFGIQLSGRRFRARRAGEGMRGTWDGGDGGAGPRWRLWRAAILSRREKDFCASAHWGRSDFRFWLALSASGHVAGRLPESVPLDYAHEVAGAQRRRAHRGRRDRRDA